MPNASAANRRQLMPFAAVSASYFAHIGFFNPYLPLWLKELGFGFGGHQHSDLCAGGYSLVCPLCVGLAQRPHRRAGQFASLWRHRCHAVRMYFVFELGPIGLGLVLLVMFTNTSAMMPMSEAAMAHLVSQGGAFDAKKYGRVRLFGSIGFLFTVFLAGAWFEYFGMHHFPGWTVLSLAAVAASVWMLPNLKEAVHLSDTKVAVWPVLRQKPVMWFFIAAFFHVLSHMGVYVFFSLYLDSLGYSKVWIGMLWAVSVIVEIGWFFTQAKWMPKLPLTAWLVVCSVAMVLRMGMTAQWADVLWVLLLAQAIHALTFAAHHTACIALLSHHFPGRLRGRGQALYTVVAYGFPGVLGGLAGGLLSDRFGLQSVYWLSLIAALIATAAAYRVWRLQHPKGSEQLSH
jgi:MFS transporter, PPP family, 3-phenylpropionic acid transporter